MLIVVAAALVGCTAMTPADTGETCTDDDDCLHGRCVEAGDDTRVRYCTQICAGDGYCPSPMQCIASMCRHPMPSPGALGATCTGAADCVDQLCVDSACTIDCASDGACPVSFECRTDGAGSFCVAPEPEDRETGCAAGHGSATTLLIVFFVLFMVRRRCWMLVTGGQSA